jgi:hypothetical protein
MTDVQLYMTIGIPSVLALLGILINVSFFLTVNNRIQSLENRLDGRIDSLAMKFDTRFDLLLGKIFEIDNRLSRVGEQLKR